MVTGTTRRRPVRVAAPAVTASPADVVTVTWNWLASTFAAARTTDSGRGHGGRDLSRWYGQPRAVGRLHSGDPRGRRWMDQRRQQDAAEPDRRRGQAEAAPPAAE